MATLNPNILLAQQQYKLPDFNMGETLTNIARIKAYQQSQRLDELKYGQAERAYARDEDFQRLASQLYTPDQPAASTPPRGLTGGSPPLPGGPPPPAPEAAPQRRGSGVVPMTNMAASVPPAMPGENYAGRSFQAPNSPFVMQHTPPADPGLAGYEAAPVTQQPMAALMGPGGQGLGAVGSPNQDFRDPQMSVGIPEAPPEVPTPRGLAVASPSPAAPPAPPGGLGGAQPGEPKPLMPQMNERVMMQLYAANPEKAGKLIEGQLSIQSKKLEQTEKMNELIYMGLTALQSSPEPEKYYPIMLADLREQGVRIPASFPKEYQPGLMAFKLREHETLKSRLEAARVEVERVRALHLQEQAKTEQAQQQLHGATTELKKAETGAVPSLIAERKATTGLREAEAGAVPASILRDKALTEKYNAESANLIEQRRAKAGQVTEYTSDSKQNVYLSQAAQELKLPPGTQPTKEVIDLARRYQVEDQQKVVRQTGMDAIQKQQGPAATKRLEASNAKGSSAEQVMNVLDEIDRLIDEGVYENVPTDQTKMLAFWGGFRPDDAKAARTKRLYELGNQLTVGMAPNGSLGAGMSEGDRQTFERAGGDLQSNQAALSRKETIKSMRTLGKINMQDANHVWETHDKSGEFPRFGSAREERLKIITPRILDEAYEARKKDGWTKEQIREGFLKQGYREE